MGDKPDLYIAKRYLEKALQWQSNHPVANYRLGYLYYRRRESFYTLYGIVTANGFRTYRELQEIATNGSDDYIRQIIRRLSRDLPYWGHFVETTSILHPETRRPLEAIVS